VQCLLKFKQWYGNGRNAMDFPFTNSQNKIPIFIHLNHLLKSIRSQDVPERDKCMVGATDSSGCTVKALYLTEVKEVIKISIFNH
jgi:hypothetical protein